MRVPWPERPKGAKDKSRGPKGLQLEVGAQRAPKLLVLYISKGPGSLEGLVRIWKIWVFLVLPGLQMNSKAYHNPHAN